MIPFTTIIPRSNDSFDRTFRHAYQPHPLIRILILIFTVFVVYNLKIQLNFLYSYYYSTLCISLLLSPSVLLCGRSH